MRTTIESYKARSGRLNLEGIDFDAFKDQPLSPDALRCIRYMHDIEHHTICYLRDLLLTPAHQDPEVTSFLSCWAFEELWHGEALGAVLEAHGEIAGAPRIERLRRDRRVKDKFALFSSMAGSTLAGNSFIAVHMSWGAINEWTTQSGYSRLSTVEHHPVLTELLKRIMKQEGGHIDFYASEASRRLAESTRAQKLTRFALKHFWRPVGSGVMPKSEVAFMVHYLFGGDQGDKVANRVDSRVDRLPGQEGLNLMHTAIGELALLFPQPTTTRQPQGRLVHSAA